MKNILLSLICLLCLFAEGRILKIYSTNVNQKKQNGKLWDAFKGKPDIIVSLFKKNGDSWEEIFKSKVASNTYNVDFNASIKLQLGDKIKIVVTDKDIKKNDLIGEIEIILATEYTKKTALKFGAVNSFSFELAMIPLTYKESRLIQDIEYFIGLINNTDNTKIKSKYLAQAKEKLIQFSKKRALHPKVKELQNRIDLAQAKKNVTNIPLDYRNKKRIANIEWFLQTSAKTKDTEMLEKYKKQIQAELEPLVEKYPSNERVLPLVAQFKELEKRIVGNKVVPDSNNDVIDKVTKDKSEADNNSKHINKNLEYTSNESSNQIETKKDSQSVTETPEYTSDNNSNEVENNNSKNNTDSITNTSEKVIKKVFGYKENKALANIKYYLSVIQKNIDAESIEQALKNINYAEAELLELEKNHIDNKEVIVVRTSIEDFKKQIESKNSVTEIVDNTKNQQVTVVFGRREEKTLRNIDYYLNTMPQSIKYIEKTLKNPRATAATVQSSAQQANKNLKYASDALNALEKTHAKDARVIAVRTKIEQYQKQINTLLEGGKSKDVKNKKNLASQGGADIDKIMAEYNSEQMQFSDKRLMREIFSVKRSFAANPSEDLKNKLEDFAKLLSTDSSSHWAKIKQAIVDKKNEWNKGTRAFSDLSSNFEERNKKLKEFLNHFTNSQSVMGVADFSFIEKYRNTIDSNGQTAFKYTQFFIECEYIRQDSSTEQSHVKKANKMAEDKLMKELLDYYANFSKVFEDIDSRLKALRTELLNRVEKASKKAEQGGFAAFRDQYEKVAANRLDMLQNPNKYQGKIIDNAKFKVMSWNKTGWYLPHGNTMFSYVWDPELWKTFRHTELEEFKIFRDFRDQILKEKKMTKERHIDWRYPGLVDIELVAIIDGTKSYTPVREVLDKRGNVLYTEKLPAIEIINARVVGLKSRYFTLWLGGENTLNNLDITGLPR